MNNNPILWQEPPLNRVENTRRIADKYLFLPMMVIASILVPTTIIAPVIAKLL